MSKTNILSKKIFSGYTAEFKSKRDAEMDSEMWANMFSAIHVTLFLSKLSFRRAARVNVSFFGKVQ